MTARDPAILSRSGLRIANLRDQRVRVGNRWVSVAPDCPHGERAGYNQYSCRCDGCGEVERQYRKGLRQQPIPRHLHGTAAGRNRGCQKKCCVQAKQQYDHARYATEGPRWSRTQAEERGQGGRNRYARNQAG